MYYPLIMEDFLNLYANYNTIHNSRKLLYPLKIILNLFLLKICHRFEDVSRLLYMDVIKHLKESVFSI